MRLYGGAVARRNMPQGMSVGRAAMTHGGRPMEWATLQESFDPPARLPDSPTQRLIRAVLLQALSDLTSRTITHGDARWRQTVNVDAARDARAWLAADLPDQPFSFVWCCDALGLAPTSVRRRCQRVTITALRHRATHTVRYVHE